MTEEKKTSRWETIREKLFGTWDRGYTFVGASIGVVSFIVSVFVINNPLEIPLFIVIRDLVVVFALIVFAIYLLVSRIRLEEKLKSAKSYLLTQTRISYDIADASISELFQHYKASFLHSEKLEVTKDEFKVFERMCLQITGHVKESFNEYFKSKHIGDDGDIAVAVKLILPSSTILELYSDKLNNNETAILSNSSQWVMTVYRDSKTYGRNKTAGGKPREIGQKLYNIEMNTAFSNIVIARNQYFQCDNLKKHSGYNNENRDWEDHYNATLVVPIALVDEKRPIYFGFLAVDSKNERNEPLYEDEECRNILCHAADMLCAFFLHKCR